MAEKTQRRLAAIIAADVVEYTRLMRLDEEATMAAWWSYRQEIIDPMVADHGGRVVKLTGDGFLAEFSSATGAVAAAIAMQSEITSRVGEVPEDRRVLFRMGINIGDIVWDDDDIYGDGVNIAARIEALAKPGGIFVSANIYDQVHHRLTNGFEDMGEHDLKNIDEPVRVYQVVGAGEETVAKTKVLPLSDQPSVAVLQFENKSSDAEQDYFADGLTENIITGLTRFHNLFVIAVKTALIAREKGLDAETAAREFGVAHIVEGSVHKAGNRVRVTAQLVEAVTSRRIWAETYDRDLEDIFAIQDEITNMIVVTVAGQMEAASRQRAERKDDQEMAAFDFVLRGRQCLNRYTKEADMEARIHFERALELDPNCATAYAGLAVSYAHECEWVWSEDRDAAKNRAYEMAQKAVALDPVDEVALYALAHAYFFLDQHDQAKVQIDRAINLNPNNYHNLCAKGWFCTFSGDLGEGMACLTDAMRRNPYSPNNCLMVIGLNEYMARHYDAALVAFSSLTPTNHIKLGGIAACFGQLDRTSEAKATAAEFLKLVEAEFREWPSDEKEPWRVYWRYVFNFANQAEFDHLMEGLRKAGLPA
jgi:adenylate cyclase